MENELQIRIVIIAGMPYRLTLFTKIQPAPWHVSADTALYIIVHLVHDYYSATKLLHIPTLLPQSMAADASQSPSHCMLASLSPTQANDADIADIDKNDVWAWPFTSNDNASYFTIVSLNAQGSLGCCHKAIGNNSRSCAKLDYLRHINGASTILDIICLSETKLSAKIDDSEIDLTGY